MASSVQIQELVSNTAAIRQELTRILGSPVFASSPRMSRFLRVVVEAALAGEASALKEYAIGCSVFDRDSSFDPRLDPVVRNEARRLRKKLQQYYDSVPAAPTVRISLPKGGYVPAFETAGPEPETSTGVAGLKAPSDRSRKILIAGTIISSVSVLVCLLLLKDWRASSTKHRPNPNALAAWQSGRRDVKALDRPMEAMPQLRQAIRLDPQFAEPYATLAAAYGMAALEKKVSMVEGMRQAKELAERALELDSQSAEGYLMLGAAEVFNRDWPRAEDLMRHSLRIRSTDAFSLNTFAAIALRPQGKLTEAAAILERATQLEPNNVGFWRFLISVRCDAHQYLLAIDAAQRALQLHPGNTFLKWDLGISYVLSGDVVRSARSMVRVPLDSVDYAIWSIYVARAQHRYAEAARIARQSVTISELDDADRAAMYAIAGDEQKALMLLNVEEDHRSLRAVIFARLDDRFSAIRSHPAFQQLLRRMRLIP